MARKILKKLEERVIDISGRDFEPKGFSLEMTLAGASHVFRMGANLRLALYESGLVPQKHLGCFTISVGNISAGGTGKTPMAIYLATLLLKLGKTPVVLSRGYKGSSKTPAAVVGDGQSVFLDAKTAGDEPFMMAARKSFPVVVGRDRHEAGLLALKRFRPDVLILDDGFQHLRLKRDLDILLFDHDRPLGNNRFLPAGRLRESLETALRRTHAMVFTRCPKRQCPGKKSDKGFGPERVVQKAGQIPRFKTFHVPFLARWVSSRGGGTTEFNFLEKRKALVVSGIANNPSFKRTVQDLGLQVVEHLEFTDHYRYKGSDILMIREKMASTDANILVTTEKDWVRFDPKEEWPFDLAVIGIKIKFDNEPEFCDFIRSRLPSER